MAGLSFRQPHRIIVTLLAAGFALTGAGAVHAADQDVQIWSAMNVTGAMSDKIVLGLDGQARFSDDATRIGQLIVRPSLGWRLDPTTTATLGYAYIRSSTKGRSTTHEHRGWQQMSYRLAGDGAGLTLTGRTRVEQRWVEDRGDAGWRMRQQIRVTAPVKHGLRAVAWTEPFVGLNQTSWGQRDGLHLWRNFVGLSIPVSKSATLEPGYLHQHAFRAGPDVVTQAAAVWVNLQF